MQQARLFLKEQHFEKIADRLGMADDVMADTIRSKLFSKDPCQLEHCQFALDIRRVCCIAHPERSRLMQQGQQQRLLLLLGELRVGRFNSRDSQKFADHDLVQVRALAKVRGSKMKSENLSCANEGASRGPTNGAP